MRLPLIFGILLVLLGILVDTYIYMRLRKQKKPWPLIYLCSTVITNLLMVAIVAWPKRDAESNLLLPMWLLFAWMSVYISKIIYCLFSLLGRLPMLFKRAEWPFGKYIGLPLGLLVFCLFWYGALIERHMIDVENVTIESPRIPRSFDGFRIVQFSDAHVGTWGNDTTFIKKLVEEINSLDPDVIVFTGDIVNRQTNEVLPFTSILSQLHAPYGVYSIMGNHDYGDYSDWPSERAKNQDTDNLRKIIADMGWHALDDAHVMLYSGTDSIALVGVENWGEPPFKTYGNLGKAMTGLTGDLYTILLSHNPMHWHNEVRHDSRIDLTLSGHTHAMQMRQRTPWKDYSFSALKYPEWEGLTEYRNKDGHLSQIYVNIGCGEVGFPARIGAMPEITVITLKHTR